MYNKQYNPRNFELHFRALYTKANFVKSENDLRRSLKILKHIIGNCSFWFALQLFARQ